MTRANDIASLVDSAGDIIAAALDNVPPSNDASALTTGTLAAARLPSSGVSANSITTGTLGSSQLPAGTVLQSVHVRYDTETHFSSTSFTAASGFTASITPRSTSSKILVILSVAWSGKGDITIYRTANSSTSNIFPAKKSYNFYEGSGMASAWNSGSMRVDTTCTILDSPSSTSSVSYAVYGRGYNTGANSGGINEGGGGHQGSSITLLEVAG